jgi:hypothetical protein
VAVSTIYKSLEAFPNLPFHITMRPKQRNTRGKAPLPSTHSEQNHALPNTSRTAIATSMMQTIHRPVAQPADVRQPPSNQRGGLYTQRCPTLVRYMVPPLHPWLIQVPTNVQIVSSQTHDNTVSSVPMELLDQGKRKRSDPQPHLSSSNNEQYVL